MAINFQQAEFIRSATAPKGFSQRRAPQVAFAGRSNVGKSSVINRLLGRKNFARVGAAPGKTVHINYFLIDKTFLSGGSARLWLRQGLQGRAGPVGPPDGGLLRGPGADDLRRHDRGRPSQAHRR